MENKKVFTRYTFVTIALVIAFAAILLRLADIQIVQGDDYRRLAQDKSIRTVDDDAPRGKITDRNGFELATNNQSYTIFMMKPQDQKEEEKLMLVIERLVDILNKNNEKITDDFNIAIEPLDGGEYNFKFYFPNNYEDEVKKQEYIDKQSARWKKDNGIPDSYDAKQSFEYLVEKYSILPVEEEHKNIPFIRQMMVIRQMIKDKGYMAYKPVEIAYVNRDTAFEIMEKGLYLPGVDYKLKPVRTYPSGELASLVLGSLRKIPAEKAQEYKDKQYDVSVDLIGRDGIEAYAEDDLRGEKGGRTVKVDAYGRIVEELGKRDPIPGNNIVLTLDKNLQAVAENALDDIMQKLRNGELGKKAYPYATRGAAVVIDVKTGEVLAMASRPGGYNPNIMAVTGSFNEEVRKILIPQNSEHPGVDPERIIKPMFNYATMGAVPPGSTFKMVSAIAGLETGEITPSTIINDTGQYRVVPGFYGNCWIWNYYQLGGHGRLNVTDALKVSCNYFFFEVGRRIGLDNLSKYAKSFGLASEPSGIEIYESPGDVANKEAVRKRAEAYSYFIVLKEISEPNYDPKLGTFTPTDEQKELIKYMIENNDRDSAKLKDAGITSYKMRSRILQAVRDTYNEYSRAGLVLNASIGQGENRFTPLQIASYIATIANGGTRYRPHLIKEITKADGTIVKEIQPEVLSKIEFKPDTLSTIIAGMDAVTGEGGTAGAIFRNFPVKTAGKTGTAQASGSRDDYAWFAGFAPAENPEIAVAVVIYESGGYGASNVAKAIYEEYFKLNAAQPVTNEIQTAPDNTLPAVNVTN
ncbi:stage V sporulation protein D [Oxobacter pfennigii]|uniref:Stage V sporulation protein D n=1 Tax=Oxobacter pfennigii TaxID=36849 RepID=A0A0P9AB21_9CLOT|nr:penicillin-binding transpeptidase domain-containing protein [Oxobacter pfennigii]KPU42245.1 stage V sporulation protein D [Oxobacter pfennigii]